MQAYREFESHPVRQSDQQLAESNSRPNGWLFYFWQETFWSNRLVSWRIHMPTVPGACRYGAAKTSSQTSAVRVTLFLYYFVIIFHRVGQHLVRYVSQEEIIMRKRSALVAGIIAGISSPATVIATPDYPRVQGTDLQRMRQDVRRVGNDFSAAISRYHGQKKK
ncbi:MAG TPA: hypothetical protein VK104_03430 [Burkholderiaceae bacterium]|nr:hypothetical protein [Burkholderiaceae bacterium]